jgi:CRISPR-associated protein Cpf1
VPAWNTSKIDPVTGFVNLFDTRYENVENSKKFFEKFDDIRWNKTQNHIEFHVTNYADFNPKAEGTRQNWIICSQGTRLENFRNDKQNNQWDTREVNLTEEFLKHFRAHDINPEKGLKEQIVARQDKQFFERLHHLLKLTLQMRNSRTGSDEDYLISPVADEKGVFFDSRYYAKQEVSELPKDADANGAYNIARKGLLLLKKIKETKPGSKANLKITNMEWLNFAQNQYNKKGTVPKFD